MTKSLIALLAVVLLCSTGMAQDPQPTKQSETEQPKNSVQQMIEDAKKRGDVILVACLEEDCPEGEQVTSGVEPGRAIELVKPAYPPIARAAHASGEVRVQVIIDTDGSVIAAAAVSGHPLLQAAAVSAARNTRFSPSKYNGEPVKVTGVVLYNFVLP